MILGILIIVIGVLYLLSVIDPSFAINYSLLWPIALIVLCLYSIFKNKRADIVPAIGLFFGLLILGVNCELWSDKAYEFIWPGILIIVGLSIIFKSVNYKKRKVDVLGKDGIHTYNGILAGVEEKVESKDFKGADIYAVFGGVDLDLRNIEVKDDIVINVYSVFGGTTLLVPENYNIKINSTAVFGGNENKTKNKFDEKKKTININCVSVFGGTEIK